MSRLGDVLELMHLARGRVETARLEVREWRDVRRTMEAYDARLRAAGAPELDLDAAQAAPDVSATVRAWYRQPNCVREEREEGGRQQVSVADGKRWWTSLPGWGTLAHDGDGWALGAAGSTARFLLDPAPLAGSLDLEIGEEGRVAGRATIRVTGVPPLPVDRGPLEPLDASADRYRVDVDLQRGVLLRATAELDGTPYVLLEAVAAAFDEPLDDGFFRYEPEAGEPVLAPGELAGETVAIEEAALRASFTVLAPRLVEPGWQLDVRYTPARERPSVREAVDLTLRRPDATHTVSLHETAPPFERWQLNGTEPAARDGRDLRVSSTGWNRVLLEDGGTCVEAGSATVDVDALAALVLDLVPAPRERPPLVA